MCTAQPTRLELLSRSNEHTRRPAGSAISAAPELSRDGNFVLFLSAAGNLTTNVPTAKPVMNLYMVNRETRETTLLSVGVDGRPANESIVNFEISADNGRVLIETSASNMVANDTNNVIDVFVRDLAIGQNVLATADTNGAVSRRGGFNATMSADGNLVTFMSTDVSLVAEKSGAFGRVYIRNIAAGTTQALPTPLPDKLQYAHDASISDTGRYVAFGADFYDPNVARFQWTTNLVCDLQASTSTPMGQEFLPTSGSQPLILWDPIITPNGKFVTFGIQIGSSVVTNLAVRYAVETGSTELIASNNIRSSLRPLAISSDGGSILYSVLFSPTNSFIVWREGREPRVFPHADDGTAISLPTVTGVASMSADGRFVTFSGDLPLLPTDGKAFQFRSYIYDVENDTLSALPGSSPLAPPSDPVPNTDGSVVVFSAAQPGIQEESEAATQNIYAWDRASGSVQLLSQSHSNAFENTAHGESKLHEASPISEDGTKMVFASRTPATDVVDTNGTWDIFLLDRTTGRKQLVSVAADGASSGSHPSVQPAVSGNGRVVAFFSRAINLVATAPPSRREQLYIRDLDTGVTRLITTSSRPDIFRPSHGVSFSHDGNRLAVVGTGANYMDQVYVYDWASNKLSLVSYTQSGAEAATMLYDSAISSDGQLVAFRSASGTPFGLSASATVFVRSISSGVLRAAPIPLVSSAPPGYPRILQFNRANTALFYGIRPSFLSWDLSGTTYSVLANSCQEASVTDDGKWAAFARRDTILPRMQVWLRDVANNTEVMISSNVVTHAVGNRDSIRPKITSDGRFIVFQSRATNLVANDSNGAADLFIYDRDKRRLELLTSGRSGGAANGPSLHPVMSPDSSYVAFVSYASDLVSHDYNEGSDIFAAYLPGPDTDADGIDDRWEIAQFGDLNHDLTGDSDGDGMSDSLEFAAGTNPTQAASAVRVVSATVDGDQIVVNWSSVPGRAYRLQARLRFDSNTPWVDASDTIVANGVTSSFATQLPNAPELYFRIVAAD